MRGDRERGYSAFMGVVREEQGFEVECPHCHKNFAAEPIDGGRAARYLGFKCPHCRLFVPLRRATDSDLDAAS
jgi:hypothetical protein